MAVVGIQGVVESNIPLVALDDIVSSVLGRILQGIHVAGKRQVLAGQRQEIAG